jgi:hypothetical protein
MAHQAAEVEQLMSTNNETFMAIATDHIAATYALRLPREVATAALRRYEANVLKKNRKKKKREEEEKDRGDHRHDEEQGGGVGVDVDDVSSTDSSSSAPPPKKKKNTCLSIVAKDAKVFVRKFKGGGLKPPPAFGYTQTAYAFVGSLLTLMAITHMDRWFAGGGSGN